VRPGPGGLQAHDGAAGVEGQAAGGVQQPVAQRLGLADGEFAVEGERLCPGGEVLGDQRDLDPDGVVIEAAEGEVLKPGLLGGADAVLGVGAGAVQPLTLDGVATEIGQRDKEAVPVVVAEAQLGAGVRAFAADEQPRPVGPAAQVDGVVISATHAPSRTSPSWRIAGVHADSGSVRIAPRTASVRS
jgi:hypothetical protein